MRKVVFLDRDGTIIVDKVYLNDPGKIEYFPDTFSALRILRDDGFDFAIVTNQSGVPRGLVDLENLKQIHARIRAEFARHGIDILDFYYAPFLTNSNHPMRKPNPGMIEQAMGEHHVDPAHSWMIGDRMVDVEAGHRAGLRSIMLRGRERPEDFSWTAPEAFVTNLTEAAKVIMGRDQG